MKPVDFRYERAVSVDDAVRLLTSADGEGKILAGGQSLGPLLNMRLVRPAVVIDINGIADLTRTDEHDAAVRIGALVRQREAERSETVARRLPLMAAALPYIGHSHTRNRGTVVGSIVHADPSAELPLVAICLDAELEIAGPDGTRTIAVEEFYQGYLMTDLAHDEVVVAATFTARAPAPGTMRGAAFDEMARREGDFAIVAACAEFDVDTATQRVVAARVGVTGVGPAPLRDRDAEAALIAADDAPAAFAAIAARVAEGLDPDADLHATADYRRTVASVLLARVFARAWERAVPLEVPA